MADGRALIVGASRGLGAYAAQELARRGWDVVGVARSPRPDVPGEDSFAYVQADIGSEEQLAALAARVDPLPDLVVVTAVTYLEKTNEAPRLEELERVFRVNALAPYVFVSELLAQKVNEDASASVVVVNSEAMFQADADSGVHGASKAALRVLTAALADRCRGRNVSVSTLLLGPLADKKLDELRRVAERRGVALDEITRLFLRKSNPNLVLERLIDYEACLASILYMHGLGSTANGMVCRLDGGSAGSLI